MLFHDIILSKLARVPRFEVVFFSETGDVGFAGRTAALPRQPRWFSGRIVLGEVWPQLVGPASRVYYLSGPPDMLTALGADLQARGVKANSVHTDAWE